jgi:hypothetical protein
MPVKPCESHGYEPGGGDTPNPAKVTLGSCRTRAYFLSLFLGIYYYPEVRKRMTDDRFVSVLRVPFSEGQAQGQPLQSSSHGLSTTAHRLSVFRPLASDFRLGSGFTLKIEQVLMP